MLYYLIVLGSSYSQHGNGKENKNGGGEKTNIVKKISMLLNNITKKIKLDKIKGTYKHVKQLG